MICSPFQGAGLTLSTILDYPPGPTTTKTKQTSQLIDTVCVGAHKKPSLFFSFFKRPFFLSVVLLLSAVISHLIGKGKSVLLCVKSLIHDISEKYFEEYSARNFRFQFWRIFQDERRKQEFTFSRFYFILLLQLRIMAWYGKARDEEKHDFRRF